MTDQKKAEIQRAVAEVNIYQFTALAALNAAHFCLINLETNPITRGKTKQRVTNAKRFIAAWLKSGNARGSEYEEVMGLTDDQASFLLETNMSLATAPAPQLEWLNNQIQKLVLAAHNRENTNNKAND